MFKLFLLFALAFAEDKVCNVYCKEGKCTEGQCSECIPGDYILDNGVCYYKLEKNCQSFIEEKKKCEWCLDGYKVDTTGKCVSGDETCSKYYEEKGGIMECPKPECAEGEMKLEGTCVKCAGIDYCEAYTKDGEGCKCTKCEGGAQLKEGKCDVRDKYCAKNVDNDDSKCQTCRSGYYLKGDKCEKGTTEDCMTYNSENKCIKCINGEEPVNGNCVCKVGGCAKCVSGNVEKCETCENDYFLENGACIKCDDSCATCSGEGKTKCLSCEAKHFLSNGECKACHGSCATCIGAEKCLTCAEGFVEVDTPEEVDPSDEPEESAKRDGEITCYQKIDGCTEYLVENKAAVCTECTTVGYYQSSITNGKVTCSKCDDSCATCEGEGKTKCLSCAKANTVLVTGECKECHESCATCSEAGKDDKCTACAEGKTFLDGQTSGKCYDKIPGCGSHKLENEKVKCAKCASGYYYANSDGSCKKIPGFNDEECYQFNADGTCGTCEKPEEEGYEIKLENGECEAEYPKQCFDATLTSDECLVCIEYEKGEEGLSEKYSWPEGGSCEGGAFGVFIAFFIAVIMVLF